MKTKKILFIEDDDIYREAMVFLLENHGYNVMPKNDVIDISEPKKINFDLAIVDYHLPTQDGLSFAREIKKQYGQQMPVLIISSDDNAKSLAYGAGFKYFFSKPVDFKIFFKLLSDL